MSFTRRLIVVCIVVLAGCGIAVAIYPPARLLALTVAGRAKICSVSEALKSEDNEKRQTALKDQILAASKMMQEDPAGYQLWETPHRRYWIPKGSRWVLPFNLAEQERKIYGTDAQSAQPGDIVLDCGANIGVTVQQWLQAGAKKIIAIEPAPENIECLRRNFPSEIASGQVVVYPKGVWDKDDTLTLRVDPENSAADSFVIRRDGARETKQIPLTTVDKLVSELGLDRVDFIKMDIEGAEQRALAGAQATIARYHPRLSLCTYHLPDDPERIPALVRQAWSGYKMECGPCAQYKGYIRPDVVYFRP
jgi:FkbM family methyltransferase